MKTFFIISFIAFFWLNVSCKKDKNILSTENEVSATIFDTGSIASDGCDFVVKMTSESFHPDNLDPKYKINNSKVILSYDVLNLRYQCGMGQGAGMRIIRIRNIRKFQ